MSRSLIRRGAPLAIFVLIVGAIAAGTAIGTTADCSNPATLSGSAFEIDTDANLVVNTPGCIDWLTGGSGTDFRSTVKAKIDRPTGTTDDSFGNGTKENDANPTIVDGSIPNNKSDLKVFGVNTETNTNGKFLELFWTRVNSAQGTANMDFELNQKFCDPSKTPTDCANNSHTPPETPIRTTGDKLITYDLSQGGSVPTISIRTWNGSSWGPAVCLFTPGGCAPGAPQLAIGSINSSGIGVNDAGKVLNTYVNPPVLQNVGPISELSFGEAAIDFKALFSNNQCGSFGSAYLKSRSSTSFTSEIKDFIAPERVTITNCPTTIATTLHPAGPITVGDSVFDSATLSGATADAGGTVTYTVYSDSACTTGARDAGTKPVTNGVVTDSNSLQFNTAGTFYWQAVYSGDPNNGGSTSPCQSETLVVNPRQPSIATTLHPAGPITVGDSVFDSATLSGATADAGGTVTYTVYSDDQCSQNARDAGTKPVTNGVVTDSNSLQFNTPGDFYWQASYSGDANNEPAKSDCQSEHLVVVRANSNVQTAQSLTPQDSADLSAGAGGTPIGNVTFKLYGPSADPNQPPDCTGIALYTETVGLTNGSASTSNGADPSTAYNIDDSSEGTYSWQVIYGGDSTHNPVTSCVEHFTVTITNGGIVTSS